MNGVRFTASKTATNKRQRKKRRLLCTSSCATPGTAQTAKPLEPRKALHNPRKQFFDSSVMSSFPARHQARDTKSTWERTPVSLFQDVPYLPPKQKSALRDSGIHSLQDATSFKVHRKGWRNFCLTPRFFWKNRACQTRGGRFSRAAS